MPIHPDAPFPIFNPAFPTQALAIPDNLTVAMGRYVFSFKTGAKNQRRGGSAGDYVIWVNGVQLRDKHIWEEVMVVGENERVARLLLFVLYRLLEIPVEAKVREAILDLETRMPGFSSLLSASSVEPDRIQKIWYYAWHRCHIEDRAYPKPRWNGSDDFLGTLYIFLATRHRYTPNYNAPLNLSTVQQIDDFANNRHGYQWQKTKPAKKQGAEDFRAFVATYQPLYANRSDDR